MERLLFLLVVRHGHFLLPGIFCCHICRPFLWFPVSHLDQVVCHQSWFVSRCFMNRAIFDRLEHLFNARPTKWLYPNPARMSDTDDPETLSVTASLRNGLKRPSMVLNGSITNRGSI
jgi:hypothetical protein